MVRDMPDYPCDDEGDIKFEDCSEDVNTFGGEDDEDDSD